MIVSDEYSLMWAKQCHKAPMTGNGLFLPPIDADLGDSLWLFYPDYKYIFIVFVKPSGTNYEQYRQFTQVWMWHKEGTWHLICTLSNNPRESSWIIVNPPIEDVTIMLTRQPLWSSWNILGTRGSSTKNMDLAIENGQRNSWFTPQ